MEPGCTTTRGAFREPRNERPCERTGGQAAGWTRAPVQGRFGMLITDQHTYPSLAPPRPTSPVPSLLSVGYLGCQPIRLGTAPIAGLVARRARVRPTSRPYDPNAGQHSFCPLSISLRKQHGEPLTLASDPGFNCSSSAVLLTTSFAPLLLVWFLASRTHPIDRWGIHDVGWCVGNEPWESGAKRMERSRSTVYRVNQKRPGTLRYMIATALMHENHHLVRADRKGRSGKDCASHKSSGANARRWQRRS
jgi:hypothetical protein